MTISPRKELVASGLLVASLLAAFLFAYPFRPASNLNLTEATELYDKQWVFHYAIIDGQKTMDADEFARNSQGTEVWLTFASDPGKHEVCELFLFSPALDEASETGCIAGFDGCNDFAAYLALDNNPLTSEMAIFSYVVGCPAQFDWVLNPDGSMQMENYRLLWDSQPFQDALFKVNTGKLENDTLKLFNSETPANFLFFTLSEE